MNRIVHLGYYHRYDDGRILYKECQSLKKELGAEITYITSERNGKTDREVISGINVETLAISNKRFSRLFQYANDAFKEIKTIHPDVCHIHEFVLFFMVRRLKKEGIKIILDLHENDLEDETEKFAQKHGTFLAGIVHWALKKYEKRAIRNANAVISVTPQIIERIQKYGKPTEMVPNYPFKLKEDQTIHSPQGNNLNVICFAGGVSDIWGIRTILTAIEKEERIRFIFAGRATEKYIEELSEYKAWERTEYLGVISHAMVEEKVYGQSGIGMALLSCKDGWLGNEGTLGNTKLFEFMQQGLPVICTDYTLWEEIVKDNYCGLTVDPFDPKGILAAVQWLMNHPEESKQMGENGRRLVQEKYNWENEVPKLINIYKGVECECQ